MSDTPDDIRQAAAGVLRPCLRLFPPAMAEQIQTYLQQSIHYEPVIGIMGKSGAGKSSLCNAIFQDQVCLTSDLLACTRTPQRLALSVGERTVTLVDLPGVGETPEYDVEYRSLYHSLLNELDLIIWVLRADDRARAQDISTHRELMACGADPGRFLFVLSQVDRFSSDSCDSDSPNGIPAAKVATLITQAASRFPSSFPVMAVSAHTGHNLPAFVELMIHALPAQASSQVYRQIKTENRTDDSRTKARKDFMSIAGHAFDAVTEPLFLPSGLARILKRLRRKLIRLAGSLWDRLFG